MYNTRFKGSFKAVPIYVYKPRSIRKRPLGLISCKYYNISFTPTDPSQLSAFGVAPGLRLITNYSSSLEFILPCILVLWTGQRRTMKRSLGKTMKPLCQPGQPTLCTEGRLPCSMPRTQPKDNSSRVQPRTVVLWQISKWVSEREDVFAVFLHSRILILYGPTMSVCAKVMSKGIHYNTFSVSPDLESSRNLDTRQIRTAPYYSV